MYLVIVNDTTATRFENWDALHDWVLKQRPSSDPTSVSEVKTLLEKVLTMLPGVSMVAKAVGTTPAPPTPAAAPAEVGPAPEEAVAAPEELEAPAPDDLAARIEQAGLTAHAPGKDSSTLKFPALPDVTFNNPAGMMAANWDEYDTDLTSQFGPLVNEELRKEMKKYEGILLENKKVSETRYDDLDRFAATVRCLHCQNCLQYGKTGSKIHTCSIDVRFWTSEEGATKSADCAACQEKSTKCLRAEKTVEFIREYFEPTENRDEWVSEKDVLVLYGVFKDKTHSIGDSLQQGPILHTNMERNSPTRSLLVGRRLKPQYANIINVHDRLTNLENDDMPQNTYAPMVFTLPNKTMVVEETFFALKQGANRDNGATTQYWVNIFTATQLRRVEKGVVNASTLYKQFMEWLGKFEDAFVVEGAEETRATFAQFMGWFTATRFGTILSTLNLPRSRRSRGVVYTGVELRSAPEDAEEVFEVS